MSNSLGSHAGITVAALALLVAGYVVFRAYADMPDISPLAGNASTLPVRASAKTTDADAATAGGTGEILARPLFSRTRRPFVPPPVERVEPAPEEPQSVQAISEPPLTLQGVYIRGRTRRALILSAEASAQWKTVGDTVSGWNIIEIAPNGIQLEAGGETRDIKLYVEK